MFPSALHYLHMKTTHHFFALLAFTISLAVLTLAGADGRLAASHSYLAFVGTYTNMTSSKGIYAYEFDAETGKLSLKGVAAETPDPSYVVIHPNGKFAYAANEAGKQSTVTAFSIDANSAKLTQLNQLPALGEDPCYLSLDKTGKFLFVANYTSGTVVVFPILPDGTLGEHTALVKDSGPHAHWVEPDASNRSIYVADLGLDQVMSYPFDPAKGTLRDRPSIFRAATQPGTGPRHAILSRDGQLEFIYVLGELTSTVTFFGPGPRAGWYLLQTVSALPSGYSSRNDAAEIALYPGGRWLYTSNRGHDSIAVFSVDPANGKLALAGDFPTGGKEPRHFAIDPTGRFLLAENQLSNSIVIFRIDPATGALTQVSITEGVPSPVCLVFLSTR